jgi:hypothetical protein
MGTGTGRRTDRNNVALESQNASSRAYVAADPGIGGKPVTIDRVPHTVVKIAPADFHGHFHVFQAPESLLFLPLERYQRLLANPNLWSR